MTTTTNTKKKNGEKAGQVERDRIRDAARAWASHMQASIASLLASLDAAAADCCNNPDLDRAINDDAFNDLCDSLGPVPFGDRAGRAHSTRPPCRCFGRGLGDERRDVMPTKQRTAEGTGGPIVLVPAERSRYVNVRCPGSGLSDLTFHCADLRTDPPCYGCEHCCAMFTKKDRTRAVKCPACQEPCFWTSCKGERELVCPNCTRFAPSDAK